MFTDIFIHAKYNTFRMDLAAPTFSRHDMRKCTDLPFHLLCVWPQLSKTYGSVFTVYFGTKKVVILAGYKTVKEALVGHAEEFGDREMLPIVKEFQKAENGDGHGKEGQTILFFFMYFY